MASALPDLLHYPLALIVVALALILVVTPLVSALLAKRIVAAGSRAKYARYARTIVILWSLTAFALYALRLRGESAADVGFVAPRDPLAAYAAALTFVFVLGLAAAGRRTIDPDYAERVRRVIPTAPSDWFWFVPVALTAGICEEFLYRGYALTVVAQLTHSVPLGVVLSTAAFGLAHAYQGRRGVAGTTIFGLFFALVFVFWGSLWPCMLAHVLQDLIGGTIVSRRLAAMPPPDASPDTQPNSPLQSAAVPPSDAS